MAFFASSAHRQSAHRTALCLGHQQQLKMLAFFLILWDPGAPVLQFMTRLGQQLLLLVLRLQAHEAPQLLLEIHVWKLHLLALVALCLRLASSGDHQGHRLDQDDCPRRRKKAWEVCK